MLEAVGARRGGCDGEDEEEEGGGEGGDNSDVKYLRDLLKSN